MQPLRRERRRYCRSRCCRSIRNRMPGRARVCAKRTGRMELQNIWCILSTGRDGGGGGRGRVSVAVVVNDRGTIDGVGKLEHLVWKPRSAEEMRRLEELAQAAVGYDARRGDQVVMQNVSFSTNAA